MPDVGWFLGQLSAAPRNLTFDGAGVHGLITELASMFGQRLLPLAMNGRCRPIIDIYRSKFAASKRRLEQILQICRPR